MTITQVMYFSSVLTDAWISEWRLRERLGLRGNGVHVGVGADGGGTNRPRPATTVVPDRTSSSTCWASGRLAREVRLVDLESADRVNVPVGRYLVAGVQLDELPEDDVRRRDLDELAVPDHPRHRW